jgi:ASC-1-like (ASCH) protein
MGTRVVDCKEPWYTHILEGRKPVEGRKASPTWVNVCPGEILIFRDPDSVGKGRVSRIFSVQVTGVTRYEAGPGALRRYLEGESLARALPGIATLEEGEAVYLQWSSAEEIEKYGMLGIQVKVLRQDN